MRTLILMRHAKSSWDTAELDDHARSLSRRGERDAPRIAAALRALDVWPDAVVSSDALRTRQTWRRMAEGNPEVAEVHFTRELYLEGLPALQRLAATWPDSWQVVLALGHNPGWERAAVMLSGRADELTTANAVVLTEATDGAQAGPDACRPWAEVLGGPMVLRAWLRPRDLER